MKLVMIALTFLALVCESCSEQPANHTGYQVTGSLPYLPDSTIVFLMDLETKHMDTAYSVQGHFQFEGQVNYPRLVDVIAVDLSTEMMLAHEQFFLENKDIFVSEKEDNTFVIGSETEAIASEFHKGRRAIIDSCKALLDQENLVDPEGLRLIGCSQQLKSFQRQFYQTHSNTYFTGYELASATIATDYNPWYPTFTKPELRELFESLSEEIKNSDYGQKVKTYLSLAAAPQIGDTYIDQEMISSEGERIKWSELTDELTLIDLWASWCGPCRLQNPALIELYETYRDDGFTIIGVSVDSDENAWLKAIANDQLPWPNLIDKGKWTSNVAQQYEVHSIPDNILIDSTGTIVARDLRFRELQRFLAARKASKTR